MALFLISIIYLLNPYILLLIYSVSNIKINKLYFYFTFLVYFLFFNTRVYNNFIYVAGGAAADDSGDYIRAAKLISKNISFIDVLQGNVDPYLNHIDKAFGILQLYISKIFPPETIPFIFSLIFAILFLFSFITYPKITNKFITISPKILGIIIILNPYIIYLNQHLFRQALSIGFIYSLIIPYLLKFFIKEDYLKTKIIDYICLFIFLIISFGLHRGSTIAVIFTLTFCLILSQDFFKDIFLIIRKLVIKKRSVVMIFSIVLIGVFISYSNKYYDQLLVYLIKFKLRQDSDLGSIGIRTGYFGLLFSLYGIYSWKFYKLKEIYKNNLKAFNIYLTISNLIISLIVILSNFAIPRLLFSTNIILLTLTLLSYKINFSYIRILTLIIGLLTFSNYIFVKEGFWGKGHYILPYFQ